MKIQSVWVFSLAAFVSATPVYATDLDTTDFSALAVCNVLGVAGLTVASDDTCLSISGEVEYEFEYERDGQTGTSETASELDWELAIEAFTGTELGTSRAAIVLVPVAPSDPNSSIELDEAFVSFGDSTVLTAGYTSSIFEIAEEQLILDDLELDEIDDSHVIQFMSVLDSDAYFAVAAEDLNADGAIGAFVGYEDDLLTANLGGFVYNLYDILDVSAAPEWNLYGDALAEFDSAEVFAAFVASHDRVDTVTSIGLDLDTVFLKAAWGTQYQVDATNWTHALGLGFTTDLDPVELDFELVTTDFTDAAVETEVSTMLSKDIELELALAFDDILTNSDIEGELVLTLALTDPLEIEAWTGFEYDAGASSTIYGAGAGITYEPGGNFEVSSGLEGWTNGDMIVEFAAAKAF